MYLRTLFITLLFALLIPLQVGCAGVPLNINARQNSTIQFPAKAIMKDAPENAVVILNVDANSNRHLQAWDGETGNKTLDYVQDRAAIIDIFGRVVPDIEDNRYAMWQSERDFWKDIAVSYILPRYDDAVARGVERDANPQDNTRLTIEEYLLLIDRLRNSE